MTDRFEIPAMRRNRWRNLFRARCISDGVWVRGDLTNTIRVTARDDVRCVRVAGYDVDEDTIGCFCGICDCNDIPVYTGDVIRFRESLPGCPETEIYDEVTFSECMFCVRNYPLSEVPRPFEVIGNIFDNPHLR